MGLQCPKCFFKGIVCDVSPFAPPTFTGFITTMKRSDCSHAIESASASFSLVLLPVLLDDTWALPVLTNTVCSYCLLCVKTYRLSHLCNNEANTTSGPPYGSFAFLPTLKPHLAASAPRLDTDCWSGFVRTGVSPDYMYSVELAHLTTYTFVASYIQHLLPTIETSLSSVSFLKKTLLNTNIPKFVQNWNSFWASECIKRAASNFTFATAPFPWLFDFLTFC